MHVNALAAADRRHLLAQRDHGPGVVNANIGALHAVPPVYPSSHRCLSLQLPSRRRVVPRLSDAVCPRAQEPAGGAQRAAAEVHCRASHREEHEMADKPSKGLADVVAASTALSDIDGQAGRLSYRGYDIHQLAGAATFEESAYLLQRGSPPDAVELDSFWAEIAAGRTLGKLVAANLAEVSASQEPMEAMRTLVSLASADDPDKDSNAPDANSRKAARLTAQQPILVAAYDAARSGRESLPADPALGIAANFLLQMRGGGPRGARAERAGKPAQPTPRSGSRPISCSRCAGWHPPPARRRFSIHAWSCTPITR